MYKIQFLLVTFFLFCKVSTVAAQFNFKEGFIVKMNNDTIQGKIDYKLNYKLNKSCHFQVDGEVLEYFPNQIKGYGFSNDKAFTSQILEGTFIEILVHGDLNLFRYGNVFFVQKEDGEIYKLESNETNIEVDGKVGVKSDNRWKRVLTYLASD